MILQAAKEAVSKYGYPLTMKYENDNFHGTVKGVAIGMVDADDGEIVEVYVPGNSEQEKTEKLNNMLNDSDLLLIEDHINQFVGDKRHDRIIYKIPYCAIEHSAYKPAVVFGNIPSIPDTLSSIDIEVLLSDRDWNLNRYLNIHFDADSYQSVLDLINIFFEDLEFKGYGSYGFEYRSQENEDGGPGYYLDFYDEAGNVCWIGFNHIVEFRDLIIGVRVIDLQRKDIIKDETETS